MTLINDFVECLVNQKTINSYFKHKQLRQRAALKILCIPG